MLAASAISLSVALAMRHRLGDLATMVDSYLGWVGTPLFNLLSRYPALAAPTGIAANGVPTSMQIVGAPFADEVVFRIAQQFAKVSDSGLYDRHFPG